MIIGDPSIGIANIGDQTHNHYTTTPLPKELTITLPRINPDDLVGRENDLDELHELLSNKKRVVLVNGLGGIGKTTLAQAYVFKYYNSYHHIIWITQESDRISNDFINTAGLMANLQIEKGKFQPTELFGEIIRKLKSITQQPNLLIIDNAEQSLSAYIDQLPAQPAWHLLVTSREQINNLYTKPLDFLGEPDAIALFKKHYSHKTLTDEAIKGIVTLVDRHTLTVEIIAKTAEALRYDGKTLLQALTTDIKADVNVPHNRKHPGINKIMTYLGVVFDMGRLDGDEIWLMKQFACLPAEFHRYTLIIELLDDGTEPQTALLAENINTLANRGWLLYNKVNDSYKMHRIITEVVKKQQPIAIEDIGALLNNVSERLELDQTKDNPVDKFAWIPFGKALLTGIEKQSTAQIAILQNNLASALQDLGDYAGAKTLLEKVIKSDEKNYGFDHPRTAVSYSNLALVLKDLADYAGAKTLLAKAVKSNEKNFGLDDPVTAVNYSNLAIVLNDLGDYVGAKTLLEKALQSAEKKFGVDHPTTAIRYSKLAIVLNDLRDYAGAKTLLEKAVKSDERNFGIDHPVTAKRYSNLAVTLTYLGDYSGAKTLLEKALKSDEKNYGLDHPATANRYFNLAALNYNTENYQDALVLIESAVRIYEKLLPAGHPTIAKAKTWHETIKKALKQ